MGEADDQARGIRILLGRGDRPPTEPPWPNWPEGWPPWPTFLIADGYISRSAKSLKYVPWITSIGPKLEETIPGVVVRGFSWRKPGKGYLRRDTNIRLRENAVRLVRPYVDRAINGRQTYLAFSQACPLFILGLAEIARQKPGALDHIDQLILLQPALKLTGEFFNAARNEGELFLPLIDLEHPHSNIFAELLSGLRVLAGLTRVSVLVWTGDRVLSYDGLKEQIREAGAEWREIADPFRGISPPSDPFLAHCHISQQDEVVSQVASMAMERWPEVDFSV